MSDFNHMKKSELLVSACKMDQQIRDLKEAASGKDDVIHRLNNKVWEFNEANRELHETNRELHEANKLLAQSLKETEGEVDRLRTAGNYIEKLLFRSVNDHQKAALELKDANASVAFLSQQLSDLAEHVAIRHRDKL